MEKKRRRALTNTKRLIIRKRNKSHPPAHQQDLTDWFTKETGHEVNQSMISKILSDTYSYLNNLEKKKEREELQQKKKSSRRDWPALEAVLFE